MSATWFDKFTDKVHDMLSNLGSDKSRETVKIVLEIVLLTARIILLFRSTPPTDAEKREDSRVILKFIQYVTPGQLRYIADLKETEGVDIENLHGFEADVLIGNGIGIHVSEKKLIPEKVAERDGFTFV